MITNAARQLTPGMNSAGAVHAESVLVKDWAVLIEEFPLLARDSETVSSQRQQHQAKMQGAETRASKDLIALGSGAVLIFTPLGCAYGILSMGGEFAPGNRKFWIFFVIAFILIVFTIS
jgi:hypothetical protein